MPSLEPVCHIVLTLPFLTLSLAPPLCPQTTHVCCEVDLVHETRNDCNFGCSALSSTVDVLKHKYGLSEHNGEERPLNSLHSKQQQTDAQPALTRGGSGEGESVTLPLPSPGKTGTREDLNC